PARADHRQPGLGRDAGPVRQPRLLRHADRAPAPAPRSERALAPRRPGRARLAARRLGRRRLRRDRRHHQDDGGPHGLDARAVQERHRRGARGHLRDGRRVPLGQHARQARRGVPPAATRRDAATRRGDLMPALVGTLSLALALALAVYGVTAAIVGARTGRPRVVESARTAAYSLFALVVVANLAMLAALLANEFSLRYVASNSSRATPTFFKMLALWSADEGSLLLWNLVLAGYIAAVAFRFRRRRPETFPWALAVMFGISAFYLVLVLGPTTPFATLATAPPDGRGPLPLLQNHPLMAAHPPFLYLGFIGFTVPFAFAVASLITGRVSDAWMKITRRWTLAAWIFLTVGLVLGALWSYGVLGWGGYWGWDPVENVA